MSEKPTRWDYITTAIIAVLCACWAFYEYQNEPHKIPFEPLIAFITGCFAIWGYSRYKKGKEENNPTTQQTAEKIYNVGTVKEGNFGNTHIENQFINYGETQLPRFLTNPPFNSEYFIGREEDLKDIEKNYQEKNRLLVLVNGEGGMGKTTLAAKYWYQHEARYQHLAWLFADAGIGQALLSLAAKLNVEFSASDDEATQIAHITAALNNLEMPCLLVFDNANDEMDVRKHNATLHKLPQCHIILTSRINQTMDMTTLKVKPLEKVDAIRLFSHHYKGFENSEVAILEGICEAVDYNTLVLELLAKNLAVANEIRKRHYTLADLLADLQQKGLFAIKAKKIDAVVGNKNYVATDANDIIAAMYDLAALDNMEQYLLSNFAVLPAENITIERLTGLLQPTEEEAFDAALSSLHKKGWIEYREEDSSFKISPVIQEITKIKNVERLLADCETLIDCLNNALNRDIIHEDNYQTAGIAAYYGGHVLLAIDTPLYNLTVLCDRMGYYFQQVGNISKALASYIKKRIIIEALIAIQGENEDLKNRLAKTIGWLGVMQTSLGNLSNALIFFEKCNRLEKELYAAYPNNVDFKNNLAISYEKLGSTHSSLGNLEKALTFFEDETKLFEELYADNPNNVSFKNGLAISYQYLGNTHSSLGNLDKALNFYEKDIELSKELYAAYPNNVSFKNGLAISYSKLGETHSSLGNLDKALTFFEKDIELSKELYAAYPNNVSFKNGLAISFWKLGEVYKLMDNYNEMLDAYKSSNVLCKELFQSFPKNVDFKNNLAESNLSLGYCFIDMDKVQAKIYFKQAEALFLELVRDAPRYVQFQQFLGIVQKALKGLD